jgi:hypothetical protein
MPPKKTTVPGAAL